VIYTAKIRQGRKCYILCTCCIQLVSMKLLFVNITTEQAQTVIGASNYSIINVFKSAMH